MRGMVKWQPFNSILDSSTLYSIEKSRNAIKKPSISKDRIIEIDFTLKEAIRDNSEVDIKYFSYSSLKYISGLIEKVNTYEKYILVNKTRIYFKDIINLKIKDHVY